MNQCPLLLQNKKKNKQKKTCVDLMISLLGIYPKELTEQRIKICIYKAAHHSTVIIVKKKWKKQTKGNWFY